MPLWLYVGRSSSQATDRRLLCATCNNDIMHCQGHPGHIELPFPMYHACFLDTVLKILKSVCFMCSGLLLTEEEMVFLAHQPNQARLSAACSMAKTKKRCPFCDAPRPTYSRNGCGIKAEWATDAPWQSDEEKAWCTRPFTQRESLSILRSVSDAHYETMGFDVERSHPVNMILTVLLVPPPNVRPTITMCATSGTRQRVFLPLYSFTLYPSLCGFPRVRTNISPPPPSV